MTARTVPTMPSWTAGQRVLATQLQAISTYSQFWSSGPMFRMRQTIAQSLGNGTFTQLTMDTLDFDTDSGRGGSTPWSYTIPVGMSGRWEFKLKSSFAANASGVRLVELYKNGSGLSDDQIFAAPNSSFASQVTWTDTIVVAAGDVMSMWAYQSSGGALNSDTSTPSVFFGRLVSLASP